MTSTYPKNGTGHTRNQEQSSPPKTGTARGRTLRKRREQPPPEIRPFLFRPARGGVPWQLNERALYWVASIHCTIEEAADFFGLSRTHLFRMLEPDHPSGYRQIWDRGQANARVSLRRLQWLHAQRQDGSGVQMAIHLSKHLLGETDRVLHEMNLNAQVSAVHYETVGDIKEEMARRGLPEVTVLPLLFYKGDPNDPQGPSGQPATINQEAAE